MLGLGLGLGLAACGTDASDPGPDATPTTARATSPRAPNVGPEAGRPTAETRV